MLRLPLLQHKNVHLLRFASCAQTSIDWFSGKFEKQQKVVVQVQRVFRCTESVADGYNPTNAFSQVFDKGAHVGRLDDILLERNGNVVVPVNNRFDRT